MERLRGVETVLTEHKYDLVLYNIETEEKRHELFQSLPSADQFDGLLILTLAPNETEAERLHRSGLPIVLVDARHKDFHRVVTDDVLGGTMATRHLIELGHRRIAYISDRFSGTPVPAGGAALNRYRGYQRALSEAGIEYRPEYYLQDQQT